MRVLISGGVKTDAITQAMGRAFGDGSVIFTSEQFIKNIDDYLSKGNYFDRAIIMEQSITEDGNVKNTQNLADVMQTLVDIASSRLPEQEFIIVTNNADVAEVVYNEAFLVSDKMKVLLYTSKERYKVALFKALVLTRLVDLGTNINTKSLLYNSKEIDISENDFFNNTGVIEEVNKDTDDTDKNELYTPSDIASELFEDDGDSFDLDSEDGIEKNTANLFEESKHFGELVSSDDEENSDDFGIGTDEDNTEIFKNMGGFEEGFNGEDFESEDEADDGIDNEEQIDIGDLDSLFKEEKEENKNNTGEQKEQNSAVKKVSLGKKNEDELEGLQADNMETADEDSQFEFPDELVDSFADPGDLFNDEEDENIGEMHKEGDEDSENDISTLFDENDLDGGLQLDTKEESESEPDFVVTPEEFDSVANENIEETPKVVEKKKGLFSGIKKKEKEVSGSVLKSLNKKSKTVNSMLGNNVVQPQLKIDSNKIRDDELITMLNSYRIRGHCMVVTGTEDSGSSTLVANIANIISSMGYTVLVVDMDIKGRTQAYLNKEVYSTIHSTDPTLNSLRLSINSKTGEVSRYASIVREGYNLVTTGLAVDYENMEDVIRDTRTLQNFIYGAKSTYNFVIFDTKFLDLTGKLNELVLNADSIVLNIKPTNKSLMEFLLKMGNIEDMRVREDMFVRSGIIFNMAIQRNSILGFKVKDYRQILEAVDKITQELTGCTNEESFSRIRIFDEIPFDSEFEKYMFGKGFISDTQKGKAMYKNILRSILINKYR